MNFFNGVWRIQRANETGFIDVLISETEHPNEIRITKAHKTLGYGSTYTSGDDPKYIYTMSFYMDEGGSRYHYTGRVTCFREEDPDITKCRTTVRGTFRRAGTTGEAQPVGSDDWTGNRPPVEAKCEDQP